MHRTTARSRQGSCPRHLQGTRVPAPSAALAGVEGGRQAGLQALLSRGTVTARQPCDSSRAGNPAAAPAAVLQKDWCAQVSPALQLLSQSSEE